MSADNWTQCPRCTKEAEAKADAIRAKAEKKYGKISSEEYLKELKVAEDAIATSAQEHPTLREDYDIGVYDGAFAIDYRASCTKCRWEFKFKHEEDMQKA